MKGTFPVLFVTFFLWSSTLAYSASTTTKTPNVDKPGKLRHNKLYYLALWSRIFIYNVLGKGWIEEFIQGIYLIIVSTLILDPPRQLKTSPAIKLQWLHAKFERKD